MKSVAACGGDTFYLRALFMRVTYARHFGAGHL